MNISKPLRGLWSLVALAVAFLLVSPVDAKKKDRNQPHPHNGILTPYQPGPFGSVSLTRKEEEQLTQGKSVMKQRMPSKEEVAKAEAEGKPPSGGALCVQDVNAPVEAVWYQILNLNDYTSKVGKLKTSQNYQVNRNKKDNTVNIKTRMVLSAFPGYSFESYYDHMYYPSKSSMTWTLDYDKTSDFHDVAGHWHVQTLNGDKSRVFYACDVQMGGPVPAPLLNYIGKAALKQATAWVKRESEANPTLKHEYTPQTTTAAAATAGVNGGAVELEGNNGARNRFRFGLAKPQWLQKR